MSWNSRYDDDGDDRRRYIPVAERRRQAARKIAALKKSGRKISPIEIAGRKITTTFWGNAWSQNLESYSDYANRLPRGRTYVRNGSLIDLQLETGRVRSLVSGSEIYQVDIAIKRLAKPRWSQLKEQCAGQISSRVALLEGSLSKGVMQIVTDRETGLFPAPREISLDCSCPDWASMCKHVAATLYGVGARLDHAPQLLFLLRGVDPAEMLSAAIDRPLAGNRAHRGRVLESDELSSVFGIDIADDRDAAASEKKPVRARSRKVPGKVVGKAKKKVRRKIAAKKKPSAKKTAQKKAAKKKKKAGIEKRARKKAPVKKHASPKRRT